MGCGGSKEFTDAAVSDSTSPFSVDQALMGKLTSAGTKIKTVATMSGASTITDLSNGSVIGKGSVISMMNKEGAFANGSEERIAVSKGKTTGMNKMEFRLLRYSPSFDGQASEDFAGDDKDKAQPLYNFAKVMVTNGMTSDGSYALCTAGGETKTMLTAKRFAGMKQKYVVFDASGACVAKVKQTDSFGKELEFEIGAGVDAMAVGMLVGCMSPSGGGANAGSGTGAFG